MKNMALLVLLAVFSIVVFGCTQTASTDVMEKKDAMMEKEGAMMAEEGFEMINGKMMMVNEKTKTSAMMQKDAVLNDGTKVMTNGKVIRKDGTNFMLKEGESIWMDGSFMKAGEMMEDKSMMKNESSMMESSYTGKILAGTTSKYLEFSKADYDKALSENKKILLYFYANWCPICKREQVDTFAAFNELSDPNLIGFRVNYKDGDDDADERALAQQFGVAYQHTKVILKDGRQIAKFPDSWNKQRYLDELEKVS